MEEHTDRIRMIVRRLLCEYQNWPDADPTTVPEPFLGTCDPARVEVLFLGINPGGQPVVPLPELPDDHIALAQRYFRRGSSDGPWAVPVRHQSIWWKYGFFFAEATRKPQRRLSGAELYQALATRSLITNLVHWPTDDTTVLLEQPWIEEWITRGTQYVRELIDLTRPELIVVQHEWAWRWLWPKCTTRPSSEPDGPAVLAWYESGRSVGFQTGLDFVSDGNYRPHVLPVMHLGSFWAKRWLLDRYADEGSRVTWGKGQTDRKERF